jgi:hypothetical protein
MSMQKGVLGTGASMRVPGTGPMLCALIPPLNYYSCEVLCAWQHAEEQLQ